jgi:hypothetical protein
MMMEQLPTYNNIGVMSRPAAIGLVLMSVTLAVLNFFNILQIGYTLAAAPALFVLGSVFLFRLMLNAFHRALQFDAMDADAAQSVALQVQVQDAVTFDSAAMLAALRDDDIAGRA